MNVTTTRKDLMIVNMGPHHPSMHGVLRLILTLDGEDVIDCEPILGYLHRGMEKIAEKRKHFYHEIFFINFTLFFRYFDLYLNLLIKSILYRLKS